MDNLERKMAYETGRKTHDMYLEDKRDVFAAAALQGMLARPSGSDYREGLPCIAWAEACFKWADAMMEARSEKKRKD